MLEKLRQVGLAVEQCGSRSIGGIDGQAVGMGRRVLLRERGTQQGTPEYNIGHIGVR